MSNVQGSAPNTPSQNPVVKQTMLEVPQIKSKDEIDVLMNRLRYLKESQSGEAEQQAIVKALKDVSTRQQDFRARRDKLNKALVLSLIHI